LIDSMVLQKKNKLRWVGKKKLGVFELKSRRVSFSSIIYWKNMKERLV